MTPKRESNRRAADAAKSETRARAFVLLRFTLIIATAYLILVQQDPGRTPALLGLLFGVALLSNVVLALRIRTLAGVSWFAGIMVVVDTTWITLALLLSGRFSAEFFYLYFFVLFIAGIGENLRLIALGVIVVSSAYFFVVARIHGVEEILTTQALIRLPFLFAVAIFYGYLVDRLRSEQRQVREEAAVIRELEENRRFLKEVNQNLEAEVAERRRAEDQLREFSELKSAFVSMVAHELRNPLTAMKYAVDILDRGARGTPEHRFVDIVQRNVERSTAIINDLRDLSKIEAGKLGFDFGPVDVAAILDAAVAVFEGQAAESGVAVHSMAPVDLPKALGDPQRLEQVVVNLVSNAIKVTPNGGSVTVRAAMSDDRIQVSVEDTGPGLSGEDQARIFEPFFRTDDSRQRKITGTGLGLSICRDLVRAHGAELRLNSAPRRGARFFFELWPEGPAAREVVALEERVRELRQVRKFAVLVVAVPGEAESRAFDELTEAVRQRLVRADDLAVAQPCVGRIAVFLPSTRIDGGWAVRRALRDVAESFSAVVHGPVMYPDRGVTAAALVEAAVAGGDALA